MANFTIGSIKTGAVVINGMLNSSISNNLQQVLLSGSGFIDNSFIATVRGEPDISFTTNAIKAALAGLGGISGLAFTGSTTYLWLQAIDGTVTRSGSNHYKATLVAGLFVPRQLVASAGAAVTVSYDVALISADGTTTPIAYATAALDAGDSGSDEAYVLGAVSLNGTALDDVSQVTVDFGLNIAKTGGTLYPKCVDIIKRQPTITIATSSLAVPIGWGILGAAQTASDSTIAFDDLTLGASRGSSPITLTLDEGIMNPTTVGGSDGAIAQAAIQYQPVWDGTTDVIALSGL